MPEYKTSVILNECKKLKRKYPNAKYEPGHFGCAFGSGRVKNGPRTHGCLVGQAIRRVYPALFKIIKNKEKKGDDFYSSILDLKELGVQGNGEKLNRLQANQDQGIPWGECTEK